MWSHALPTWYIHNRSLCNAAIVRLMPCELYLQEWLVLRVNISLLEIGEFLGGYTCEGCCLIFKGQPCLL